MRPEIHKLVLICTLHVTSVTRRLESNLPRLNKIAAFTRIFVICILSKYWYNDYTGTHVMTKARNMRQSNDIFIQSFTRITQPLRRTKRRCKDNIKQLSQPQRRHTCARFISKHRTAHDPETVRFSSYDFTIWCPLFWDVTQQ